jgi:hypothetical protein
MNKKLRDNRGDKKKVTILANVWYLFILYSFNFLGLNMLIDGKNCSILK